MKKAFFLPILISILICVHRPVPALEEMEINLPTEPMRQSRVVYLKWGQKLLCDYVWRDRDTIFVVVQGKKFAVGYNPSEIDMQRSFGPPSRESFPGEIKGGSVVGLYEKSGMGALVEQIPGLYLSELAEYQAKLPPDLFKALESAGRDAFEPRKLRKRVLEVLESSSDPGLRREVLGWLQSSLGQKITALENIQFSPKTLQEMQAFGRNLQGNPPPQKRLELIRRLDAATGASEKNAEVALMILVQTATAIENALPKEKKMEVVEMRKQVDLRRPQLEGTAKRSTQTSLIYIYRALTDKELEHYVSFSESETGKAYHKMAFEALMAALSGAAEENGKAVAKILSDYM